VRLDDAERVKGTRAALEGAGRERQARAAIAQAAAGLLGHKPPGSALEPVGDDLDRFAGLADFVTLARSPIARDYKGEVDLVLDPEGPYRFVKQLYALWRACGLLGLDRADAWVVAVRAARDSMPRLRWRALAALCEPGGLSTNAIARAARHPYRSTRRALEDLVAHGVVERFSVAGQGDDGRQDRWRLAERHRPAAELLLAGSVPEISDPQPTEQRTLLDHDERKAPA
jgi:hypothetical protein